MKSGFILQTGDEKNKRLPLGDNDKEGDDKVKHP